MKYNFKYYLIIIYLSFTCYLLASFEKKEAGAREQSLANATVALENSPFAIFYNPANIQSISDFNIWTSYRNFYGMSDIYQADIILNTSIYNMNSAFSVSKYGNQLYSEIQIGIGSSYKLADNLSVGISLQGYFLAIKNYSDTQTWGLNVGFQYDYLENFSIGAQITNINNPKLGKTNEEIPKTFSLGFRYDVIKKGTLFFEFFRDVKHEQDYRAGFEYEPYNNIIIRFGVMDNTNTYSFGFGSRFNFINIDYALINHSVLGISHSITLGVVI